MRTKLPHPERYCRCHSHMIHGDIKYGPPATCWEDTLVQYCTRCGLMAYVAQKENLPMRAPLGGITPQAAVGADDGTWMVTWRTEASGQRITVMEFNPYPRRTVNMVDQGREHLLKIWEKLDTALDNLLSYPAHHPDADYEKARARAFCDVLAQLMHPFYADADAVGQEAMYRHAARAEGQDHQTPGLAEKDWSPVPHLSGNGGASKAAAPRAKPAPTLGDAQVTFVRHQLNNGLMTAEVLAGMFEVPIETIKTALED